MPFEISQQDAATWDLPPLILHPFNERVSPQSLLDNSRAALMLTGLLPTDGSDEETLKSRVLTGRYTEIRMLFYLGKDLFRWIDQCAESCSRRPSRGKNPLQPQSLARILVSETPEPVREKLIQWGVVDYPAIFRRAIALHCLFTEPPTAQQLGVEFLSNYHRYTDALYRTYLESAPDESGVESGQCRFQIYASGEYSRLLESEWGAS
jgi:hypothetical protein